MKTLLQINTEVNYGSTGRIAEGIGLLAMERGWKSYIAYGRKKRSSSSFLIPIGNTWDNYIHVVLTRLFDAHGLGSRWATRKLIAKIKALKPDVIQLHNLHGYYLNIPILFDFLSGQNTHVVWTFHDCWAITGHCTHFEDVGCDKWKTACHSCPQLNKYPASLGRDRSGKNQHLKKKQFLNIPNLTIVTVSHWLEKVVRQSFFSQVPVKTILNGVDQTIFTPSASTAIREKFGLLHKFVVLGVASVWSENKGLTDFLDLGKVAGSDITFVLIGLTPKQQQNLPQNIIGISRTESINALAEWYATADVYLNTSVEESFGMTNAEALACGTPIIVYDCTALPEMVTPEVGFLARKRNIADIMQGIEQIKSKGKNSYVDACVSRAKTLYNRAKNFEKYLIFYDSLKN